MTPLRPIAIIGLACRFPGARNAAVFWENLKNGVESISYFTEEELFEEGLAPELVRAPGYVRARSLLEEVDCFDASFFGVSPKDAAAMDPQQRVFLETAWHALEDAGCIRQDQERAIGIFAGCYLGTYLLANLCANRQYIENLLSFKEVGAFQTFLGNDKDYLTSRVAYKLNLKGPAVTVQTACSTSLVAVCQACQSLRQGESDVALAGGVTITFPQKKGYLYQEGGMLSPDGHCRAFDADAQGTVFGSGIGLVVLKRLDDALADGDTIRAIIKGSALNNDGSGKVSYTAPSVDGQAEVIALAQALGGVSAETISYLEAHGTGTPLGDPIEIAGLTQAFRRTTQQKGFCALGSVKTNIGHLDVAAGVAGLIKCVLALEHRQIPASLNFSRPNPKIDFASSPFYVNERLVEWTTQNGPRRAGVSSFGVGGTNAHVVLEEAPAAKPSGPGRRWQLLTWSAKSAPALERATDNLAEHLQTQAQLNLADVAFSLQTGREDLSARGFVIAQNPEDAVEALRTPGSERVQTRHATSLNSAVVFMFPGQGAQAVNMGVELYQTEHVFRTELDRCADWLQSHFQLDLRGVLYPRPDGVAAAEEQLLQTRMTQPALFAVEYALAKLWLSWGIKPAAMIGHSLGEYVAGCLAGVFSLEDALCLVASRARWIQEQPRGGMVAVRLAEADLRSRLGSDLSIAAINHPQTCVVAGPDSALKPLEEQLAAAGIACRRLSTSHAFHSAMMEPVLAPFTELLRQTKLNAPCLPYVSNVTGRWITDSEATDPLYWASHVRKPVLFAEGVAQLFEPQNLLLEVGPGQTLATLARQHPQRPAQQTVLATLTGRKEGELFSMLRGLGTLWSAGAAPDWKAFWAPSTGSGRAPELRRRVSLPLYPFERTRHWIQAPACPEASVAAPPPSVPNSSAITDTPPINEEATMIAAPQISERPQQILAKLRTMFHDLSGIELASADPGATFLELGFDSLFLTQARQSLQNEFGVKLTYRQLMEDASSLGALASYIDEQLPPDAPAAPAAPPKTNQPVTSRPAAMAGRSEHATPAPEFASAPDSLERVMAKQLETVERLIAQQLAFLRENGFDGRTETPAPIKTPTSRANPDGKPTANPGTAPAQSPRPASPRPAETVRSEAKHSPAPFGPYQPRRKESASALTIVQSKWLDDFGRAYTRRTAKSKAAAQAQRPTLADPRSIAGFRSLWKELVYQIVVERAEGPKLWDIDGNEYVDTTMGFGVNLFGHSPPFVQEAAMEQLCKGVAIGPQSPLAAEVADLIREFTGTERVTFCNTGSEAVLAALRVARTVTGRDKIAYFAGDYHGMFDEVLLRPRQNGATLLSVPVAPGIPNSAGQEALVLEYGAPASLDYLRQHAGELAAVLVEPVQSRHPELQPKGFLEELRRLADQTGVVLIFDEVITGFRVHPAGAQGYFGVKPDLATYGKVVGGGFPIGVLAGKAACMDALDGGRWQFGDDSGPEADMTFFAGTFVRHPLALAAARASLLHLKQRGPALQQELNQRTSAMVTSLNSFLNECGAPYHLGHFGSLFRFHFLPAWPFAPLLIFQALARGLYLREAHQNCFLSTGHGPAEIEKIVETIQASTQALEEAGFWSKSNGSSRPLPAPATGTTPARASSPSAETNTAAARVVLTEGQREIWQACQLGSEASCAYNESFTVHFRGLLQVEVMRQALAAVVARHDALRTTFAADGETQHFAPTNTFKIEMPLLDLSASSEAERGRRLAEIQTRETSTPFNLETGPLFRVQLVKTAEDAYALIFTAHHLVCDGESSGVVLADLGQFYSAFCSGNEGPSGAAPAFREFVQAQSEHGKDGEGASDETWWLEQFSAPVPVLELPADRPRPATRASRAGISQAHLSKETTQAVRRAGAQLGCTLFSMLLSTFQALLHRLTGQEQFGVGIFASIPAMLGWEGLVGHGVSMLPLRSKLEGEPSFKEFLRARQAQLLDAQEHGQYTYGQLVRRLQVPRQPGYAPLVQSVFNLDRQGNQTVDFADLELEVIPNTHSFVVFDLFLNVRETADELYLDLEYNAELFEHATVERWLGHYVTLLTGASSAPTSSVLTLPLLTQTEREHLLLGSRGPELSIPPARLHQLFEAQAQRTPEAPAVIGNQDTLTYGELDQRAQKLAEHLHALGLGPESLVGVCLERQPTLLVALLAILKAGAAYVPLDPLYPSERLAFILQDSRTRVVLTTTQWQEKLNTLEADLTVVDLDKLRASRSPRPAKAGPNEAKPPPTNNRNLAYVIYTSGSTGHPKGVAVEHRNAVAFVEWAKSVFSSEDLAGVLASTSICFDLSVFELFVPLSSGGTVILAENALQCATLPARAQITLVNTVPSVMSELLRAGALPPSVGTVNLAGEPLATALVNQLYEQPGIKRVYDLYGPSETTTYSSFSLREREQPPTIGRPIAGTRIYVVDPHLQPVPVGVRGELVIGGAGVARGYLHREELTREKFVPDTLSSTPEGRLYRTGDQGRYRSDGNLEFLGRRDGQVKMRGFRIELGEIEATLRQHPAVDACAVTVARSESSGDSWLVGHVVPAASDGGAGADSDSEWLNDVVQQFESGYRAAISENAGSGEAVHDPTLNIYAWSGLERTEQEVAQWVDGIADRIMTRRPKRLLELGCGTGLLVFRLAPQVREYWATDISQAALDDIQRRLGPAGLSEAQVKLSRQMAHDISNLPAAFFDGVLLNGVIEYFPSADYLLQVLNGVLQLLAPGGFIFFGAVPNLAVQDVFHVWEELLRAGDAEDPGALQQRARNRVAADRRLLVSPEFFRALPKEAPQITRIDIRTLGGCFENEASKLVADTSFDAILSIGEWSEEERTVQRFDWEQDHLNPAEVARRLQETRGDIFHVSRVPHGRMRQRRRVLRLLQDPIKTVGEWRKLLASDAVEPGLMELLDSCRNLPFLTDVTWSNSGSDGLCDVVFYRRGQQEPMVGQEPRLGNEQLRAHTNEPRQARLVRELVPELRRFLQAKLPGHMVPARFVLLDKLPLLPNGKVDRHALPSPDLAVEAAGDLSAAPGTPAERALAQIWCDLLRLKQVGIHDNFFDLGGHSLLVTQVIARIQSQFGVELPMRRMFEQPTIAGLAAAVEQGLAEEVEDLSEAEAERLAAGSFAR